MINGPNKDKTTPGCLQLLAVLVAIAFVVTAVLAILGTSFSRTFTDRENIKSVVSGDEIVRRFMTQAIEEDIQQKYFELKLPLANIDAANLRRAVDLMVPPAWIDAAMSDGIDNVYNFLEEGRTDDYILDYTPLMKSLEGEAGQEALTIIVAQYPPCQSSQMPSFQYKQHNIEIPCLPPDIPVSQVANQIHTKLVAGLKSDSEILASGGVQRLKWSPTVLADTVYLRRTFQVLALLWLLWLIPVGLLAVIAKLAVRSLYSFGLWFGCPLLLSGLIASVAGLSLSIWITSLLQSAPGEFSNSEDEMGQLITLLMANIAASLQNIWLNGVYFQAVSLIVLGVGGVLLALLLRMELINFSPFQDRAVE